jgi:hypothetical protein
MVTDGPDEAALQAMYAENKECAVCKGKCLKCGAGHDPWHGEPDCPECHLCFGCATPTCGICGGDWTWSSPVRERPAAARGQGVTAHPWTREGK